MRTIIDLPDAQIAALRAIKEHHNISRTRNPPSGGKICRGKRSAAQRFWRVEKVC